MIGVLLCHYGNLIDINKNRYLLGTGVYVARICEVCAFFTIL